MKIKSQAVTWERKWGETVQDSSGISLVLVEQIIWNHIIGEIIELKWCSERYTGWGAKGGTVTVFVTNEL